MSSTVIKVKAFTLTSICLTMYDSKGKSYVVNQGDPRLSDILSKLTLPISKGELVEVDFAQYHEETVYDQMEKKTNGRVRFFNVLKSRVKSWFGKNEDQITPAGRSEEALPVEASLEEIVSEIMTNAKPRDNLPEEEMTVVAVTENKAVVPYVEEFVHQTTHAVKNNTEKSFEKLLERMAALNVKRNFSSESLAKFMSLCDLPLCANGDLLVYKILKKTDKEGVYKDCHTGKVEQSLGSRVFMKESMVDSNCHSECSNGLHVARRNYVGGFHGDALFIARIRPEDVIAVPHRDAAKMRVSSYQLIHLLTKEQYNTVRSNKSMGTDSGIHAILHKLVNEVQPVLEEVEIGGPSGTNITRTKVNNGGSTKPTTFMIEITPAIKSVAVVEEQPQVEEETPVIDIVDVDEEIRSVNKKTGGPIVDPATLHVGSRAEQANKLFVLLSGNPTKENAQNLWDMKKKAKVSWIKLGLPADMDTKLKAILEAPEPAPVEEELKLSNVNKTFQELLDNFVFAKTKPAEEKAALELLAYKKKAKKGWAKLGVDDKYIAKIESFKK